MKYAIVDYRISKEEEDSLKSLNFNLLKVPKSTKVYDAISGHPDIQLHMLDNYNIVVNKDMDNNFIDRLKRLNFNLHFSKDSLDEKYPKDIILNGASFGEYFIHNLNYTDSTLLQMMDNKIKFHVNQGYTKCSTAIVSSSAIITSDPSIVSSLKNTNLNILHIPYGDIILQGMNYGFIGGCCGLLDKNTLGFFGDLNSYAYGKEILDFLSSQNINYLSLRKGKLVDRGSIFTFYR